MTLTRQHCLHLDTESHSVLSQSMNKTLSRYSVASSTIYLEISLFINTENLIFEKKYG